MPAQAISMHINLMIAEENAKRTQGDITDDYVRNLDQKYSGVIGRYLILGWRGTDLRIFSGTSRVAL